MTWRGRFAQPAVRSTLVTGYLCSTGPSLHEGWCDTQPTCLDADALSRKGLRRLQRHVDHAREAGDGDVGALPHDLCLVQRELRGNVALNQGWDARDLSVSVRVVWLNG
jgi:hypothetical protein